VEDKQIYSSARSEEIKRQLIKAKKEFYIWLNKYKSKRKLKVKPQNTPTGTVDTHVYEEELPPVKEKPKFKYSKSEFSESHLNTVISYTLFGLIILIILLGIYLTYAKK